MRLGNVLRSTCTVVFVVGCGASPAAPPAAPQPVASAAPSTAPAPSAVASAAPAASAEPAPAPGPKPVVRFTEGLSTPESVLYDAAGDRYLVSNINGGPAAADNNGYIAELSPEGKIISAKFIAGGAKNVKLDAPKGMGISKGSLYVSDITVVRKFDVKTGAPQGEIKFPKATFLNDIAIGADDKVYVSDSGLKPGKEGLEPDGTDAVYVIEKGKAKLISESKDLSGPNGLAVVGSELLVVTFGSDEVYKLDAKGAKTGITHLPAGGLDGIVSLGGDELLVSSWKASAVFRGKLGGKFEVAVPELKAPADIGYDTKRKRLLVPHFTENSVDVFDLQ